MATTEIAAARRTRAPRGAVVKKAAKGGGHAYALRFTAYGERRYVTLGRSDAGWSDAKAQAELERVIEQVRDGTWIPWTPSTEPEPEPTFHEFASEWFAARSGEWRESTQLDYERQLSAHLLPFFKDHRLSEITIAEVDLYRESKVAEARAIEATAATGRPRVREYTDAAGRRQRRNRKLKATRPKRAYLDRAEQVTALHDAAGQMDREARSNGQLPRRALLATLTFSGLRIGEALELRWRDVDLAGARLRVRQSKTDAGVRYVDLLPVLRDELAALKARAAEPSGDGFVFPSATGRTALDRNRVRNRVLTPAVAKASERLEMAGGAALPEGLTLHGLRRTFCSILVALGRDPAYVMSQMGHTDPTVTLGIYAQVMRCSDEDRVQLAKLVVGEVGDAIGATAAETANTSGLGLPFQGDAIGLQIDWADAEEAGSRRRDR